MTNHIRRTIHVASSSLSLFALVAATAPSRAEAAPAAGTNELRLDNTVVAGIALAGAGYTHAVPERGSNLDIFSAGVGLGHFVSDNVEFGGLISYSNVDGDVQIPGISGFLRGFGMLGPSVAGFGEAILGFQYFTPDTGSNSQLYTLGADAGIEKFFTDSWALRLKVTYRHIIEGGEGSNDNNDTVDAFGFGWGIAAYF